MFGRRCTMAAHWAGKTGAAPQIDIACPAAAKGISFNPRPYHTPKCVRKPLSRDTKLDLGLAYFSASSIFRAS